MDYHILEQVTQAFLTCTTASQAELVFTVPILQKLLTTHAPTYTLNSTSSTLSNHSRTPRNEASPHSMCVRNFAKFQACDHTRLRSHDAIVKCSKVAGNIFLTMCSHPTNHVDYIDRLCDPCIADLMRRLNHVKRSQEAGWEWTLRKVKQEDSKWDS